MSQSKQFKAHRATIWRDKRNRYIEGMSKYLPGPETTNKTEILEQTLVHMARLHKENMELRRMLGMPVQQSRQPIEGKIVKQKRKRPRSGHTIVFAPQVERISIKEEFESNPLTEESESTVFMDDRLEFIDPVTLSWEDAFPPEDPRL